LVFGFAATRVRVKSASLGEANSMIGEGNCAQGGAKRHRLEEKFSKLVP
jgi:hypothetical protein